MSNREASIVTGGALIVEAMDGFGEVHRSVSVPSRGSDRPEIVLLRSIPKPLTISSAKRRDRARPQELTAATGDRERCSSGQTCFPSWTRLDRLSDEGALPVHRKGPPRRFSAICLARGTWPRQKTLADREDVGRCRPRPWSPLNPAWTIVSVITDRDARACVARADAVHRRRQASRRSRPPM